MGDSATDKPDHAWNDPDGDGHNCVDCPGESIWKCDEAAHLRLPPIERDPVAIALGLQPEIDDEEVMAKVHQLRQNQLERQVDEIPDMPSQIEEK